MSCFSLCSWVNCYPSFVSSLLQNEGNRKKFTLYERIKAAVIKIISYISNYFFKPVNIEPVSVPTKAGLTTITGPVTIADSTSIDGSASIDDSASIADPASVSNESVEEMKSGFNESEAPKASAGSTVSLSMKVSMESSTLCRLESGRMYQELSRYKAPEVKELERDPRLVNPSFSLSYQYEFKYIKELEYLASPSKEMLEQVAAYYKSKYEIEIIICEMGKYNEHFESAKAEQKIVGIIWWQSGSRYTGHVVPELWNFENGRKQLLNLDTLQGMCPSGGFFVTESRPDCEHFSINCIRQADQVSCMTEAITILRNMLLFIRKNKIDGKEIDFNQLFTKDSKQGFQSYSVISIILPEECAYIDQILLNKDGLEKPIIRDFFSTKAPKRDCPRTVRAFRDLSSKPITMVQREYVYRIDGNAHLDQFPKVFNDFDLRIEQLRGVSHVRFSHSVTKTCNIYLALKGYKNAFKHGVKFTPPEIFRTRFPLISI